MSQKPLDLPMQVAKAFVKDTRAYRAKPNTIKRDEDRRATAAAFRQFNMPRANKLQTHDVKEMSEAMKEQA